MQVGLSLMSVGVLSGLVQATLIKKIVPRIGETRAVVLGFTISIISTIGYGLATHGWMIYAIILVGAFAGISGPALQSYITKHVPANEQGAVQGVYAGLASLAGIPGPLLGTFILAWAVEPGRPPFLAGASFFAVALLTVLALYLAVRTFRKDAAAAPVPPPPLPGQ
jgi:DHA1 family tetracycline resistance protein-like MFS transporter